MLLEVHLVFETIYFKGISVNCKLNFAYLVFHLFQGMLNEVMFWKFSLVALVTKHGFCERTGL